MKKHLLILSIAYSAITAYGQSPSIPNGNFENWTAITSELPQNYIWGSNSDAFKNSIPFNVIKSTDAYHGNYAVQMTTEIANGDTLPGIFVNVYPKSSNPASWHGGFAYTQKPTGISGYYKSSIASPDTGFVIAFFYKAGVMIGQYGIYFNGTHSTYTPFSLNFSPALPQNPDTVIFGAGSSNFGNNSNMRNGSMLLLDYVSFTGVTSQPALFNGDFETWQSTTINKPATWFLQRGGNDNVTGGAYKTSDAKAGSSALELITYVGERDNHPTAQGGQISTGWYPNNCQNNCQEQGGYPFSNQVDTLAFWYKYAPSGSTNGYVNINFKKNGNNIDNAGIDLFASANYQYKEIPFSLLQIPDSVTISFQSSGWQDSLLSFVGSDLKIDEIHFKSQPLTTNIFKYKNENTVSIFPNPTYGKIQIQALGLTIQGIEVYSVLGEKIYSTSDFKQQSLKEIDLSNFQKGIYFVKIYDGEKTYTKKIVLE